MDQLQPDAGAQPGLARGEFNDFGSRRAEIGFELLNASDTPLIGIDREGAADGQRDAFDHYKHFGSVGQLDRAGCDAPAVAHHKIRPKWDVLDFRRPRSMVPPGELSLKIVC